MPELPDIFLYLHALQSRIVGRRVDGVRLASPFLLRSVGPPLPSIVGRRVVALHRAGKRIVIELEGELFLVFHLMIAGRFRWTPADGAVTRSADLPPSLRPRRASAKENRRTAGDEEKGVSRPKIPGKVGLLAIDFDNGTLVMTEAGTQRRASLYLVQGADAVKEHDPGGLNVLEASLPDFVGALGRENHTLKRALTDPHLFDGIGNAYSDEILHAARLSPFKLSQSLSHEEQRRLFEATVATLRTWIDRLQEETADRFPEKVTAFRPQMAVHGRYGEPCPACGSAVQRVVYSDGLTADRDRVHVVGHRPGVWRIGRVGYA